MVTAKSIAMTTESTMGSSKQNPTDRQDDDNFNDDDNNAYDV